MTPEQPMALGHAAFHPAMDPHALLEAGALFYSRGLLEESERLDEFASDLATIRNLPARKETV